PVEFPFAVRFTAEIEPSLLTFKPSAPLSLKIPNPVSLIACAELAVELSSIMPVPVLDKEVTLVVVIDPLLKIIKAAEPVLPMIVLLPVKVTLPTPDVLSIKAPASAMDFPLWAASRLLILTTPELSIHKPERALPSNELVPVREA